MKVTFSATIALDIQSSVCSTGLLAVRSFAWRSLQSLFSALHRIASWLRSLILRTPTSVVDLEAQHPDHNLHIVDTIKLNLPDTPTSSLEAPSIKWLLETSTDPEVFLAAASLVPLVEWPLDLDVSDILHQLFDVYLSCLDAKGQVILSLEEKASTCTMALCHLYCGRILQGLPAYGFVSQETLDFAVFGKEGVDRNTLERMLARTKVDGNVLVATIKLIVAKYGLPSWWSPPKFGACRLPVLEWLSHSSFLLRHRASG
jgi:hypothetical protein